MRGESLDVAREISRGTQRRRFLLYLHAIGHFHPETVLDNQFLSSLDIGVDAKWIEDRVGIIERRTTLPLEYLRADAQPATPRRR